MSLAVIHMFVAITSKNINFLYFTSRNIFNRKMSVFTQKLNPLTGKSDWEVHDENYDYHQEIARSSFADMLHDTERNKKYFLGIKAAIEKMHGMNKKAHVLDIGTGTGLLSMMAVQCGADSVTAIEGFLPVADCAKKIIKSNGFEDKIKVISKCSLDVKVGPTPEDDMEKKCNILVTEVFDTELIGEGAIKTFTHAHEFLLEKDCLVVPKSATIYAHVVESPLVCNWNRIKDIVDTEDCISLVKIPKFVQNCIGTSSGHDIQLSQFPITHFRTIIPPRKIFGFDWSSKSNIPRERHEIFVDKVENTGMAQAVFVWWDLKMDPDEKITLSCAPYWAHPDISELIKESKVLIKDVVPWRDHWMQAVYFLPKELNVTKGEELTLIGSHDEYSLWFNLKSSTEIKASDYTKPSCECGTHFILSRTRIGQINDSTRNKKYLKVLRDKITPETVVLNLSDGSLLSVLAAKLGAKYVYNIENSCSFLSSLQQIAAENSVENKITYFKNTDEFLESSAKIENVNLVIGEPNYIYSLLPWDNFHFIYQLKNLLVDKLPKNIEIMPKKAVIKCMGVRFLNLHKIKASLENLEGFKMLEFDHMIKDSSDRADAEIEPQPLWEYPCYALTKPTEIMTFDIVNYKTDRPQEETVEIKFSGFGTMNGVVLWVDWQLDDSPKNIITTGPLEPPEFDKEIKWDMYTRQGVYILEEGIKVQESDIFFTYVTCSKLFDNIEFKFYINAIKI